MSWGKSMNNINNLKLIKRKQYHIKNKAWVFLADTQNNKEMKAYHKNYVN